MDVPVSAKAALLQELSRGPGVAYDLAARLRQATCGALEVSEGSLYPALRALEKDALVEAVVESARVADGKPRRVYHLTEKGRQVVQVHRAMVAAVFFELKAPTAEVQPAPAPVPGERWVVADADAAEEGDEVANS